jgi:gamma-glutamyltranspeptidase
MKSHRPTIMGTRHMVAATQYLAAEAGFRILEAGGNAIDAGVAAGIALRSAAWVTRSTGGPMDLARRRRLHGRRGRGEWRA